MGWFSKKEEVPEVPPISNRYSSVPELPSFPRQQKTINLPDLPSFPNDSRNQNMNQEIVKSAVMDNEEHDYDDSYESQERIEEIKKELPKKDIFTSSPIIPSKESIKSTIPMPPQKHSFKQNTVSMVSTKKDVSPTPNESEPIFVRLDKFQSAQKSLDLIKKRVLDIELTIRGIKEVKSKEDEELSKWNSETQELKSLLSEIDDEIFGKI